MQERNKWGVEYPAIQSFERVLHTHNRVESFTRSEDILFNLRLVDGKEVFVLLIAEYTLGLAAVIRALDEFPNINHIVTSGIWFSYTKEAKEYGLKHDVGVFVINEFMGALHWDEPIKYRKKKPDDDAAERRQRTAT